MLWWTLCIRWLKELVDPWVGLGSGGQTQQSALTHLQVILLPAQAYLTDGPGCSDVPFSHKCKPTQASTNSFNNLMPNVYPSSILILLVCTYLNMDALLGSFQMSFFRKWEVNFLKISNQFDASFNFSISILR